MLSNGIYKRDSPTAGLGPVTVFLLQSGSSPGTSTTWPLLPPPQWRPEQLPVAAIPTASLPPGSDDAGTTTYTVLAPVLRLPVLRTAKGTVQHAVHRNTHGFATSFASEVNFPR